MQPRKLQSHFYDLLTGTYVATVPCSSLRFGDSLNAQQSWSGQIATTDPAVQALDVLDATTPGKRVVVMDLEGVLLNAYVVGLPRRRHMDASGLNIQLTGQSMWWWLTKRVQATDYSSPPFSGISGVETPMGLWSQQPYDAALISAQLISDILLFAQYGQEFTGTQILGGISVLVNGEEPDDPVIPVGDWTAPTFPYSSLATIDSILSQITPLGYGVGIDISFDVAYSEGPYSPLVGTINIWYPRKGRTAAASQLVIDGNAARKYDLDEDSSNQGVIVYETGVTGSLAIVENVNPIEQGWPILEQVISRSGLTGEGAPQILDSLGDSDSYLSSFPIFSGTMTLPLWGADPQVGEFVTGDSAMVQMGPDANFPGGINQELRIVAWNVNAPEHGDQTMDITLNAPPSAGKAMAPTP